MAKLKYKLFELDGNVLFKVDEQDERFRRNRKDLYFEASNGVKIYSISFPGITLSCDKTLDVYLRGDIEDYDDNVVVIKKTQIERVNTTAQKVIKQIDFALKEWAHMWHGWDTKLKRNYFVDDFTDIFMCKEV